MYRPHSDAFPDFPEILSLRNCDLKTTHVTFRGCRMHFNTLCRPPLNIVRIFNIYLPNDLKLGTINLLFTLVRYFLL